MMVLSRGAPVSDPIEHVVVLMMENHSFDQMLGSLSAAIPGLDGIDLNHPRSNPDYPDTTKSIAQSPTRETSLALDPAHEFDDVQRQLVDNNNGFIRDFVLAHPNCTDEQKRQIMAYYPDGALPVLHTLAKNFAVCDRWFSSVPGPTWPNRFFVHSGTSKGHVKMPSGIFDPNWHLYDQTTLYDRLTEKGISWKIYHQGEAQSLVLLHQLEPQHVAHYHDMPEFFDDADPEADPANFPRFAFIEPCYSGTGQNDQHPPSDMMKGEILIAQVYNALRSNDTLWPKTLFVVLYDEHGGFYDHAVPETTVAPDQDTREFDFQSLGLRVPAVLVSPWLDPQVVHTVFDHTSLLKYALDKWDLGPLGARTAQAHSFAAQLSRRTSPRTDTPPAFNSPLLSPLETPNKNKVVNENQKALISFSQNLETHLSQVDDLAAIGSRSLKMMEGPRGQFAVSKDRFERFIHQTKQGTLPSNSAPPNATGRATAPGGKRTDSV
jgi:phospholipase C